MAFILWSILALLLAGLLVFVASLGTRRRLPELELPEGETLPPTRVQRSARRAVLAVGALTASAAAIVAWQGVQTWWDSDPVRLTVTFLLLAALLVHLVFLATTKRVAGTDDGSVDERDLLILDRSHAGVGGAMLVVIAVWMVALTESHHDTGMMPTYFLYLVFWSIVMTNVLAYLAGVLLAYRRS